MSTIFTSQGKKRYVGGTVTDINGKDISAATFTIGLSPDVNTLPTSFVTPDVNTAGSTTASRVLKLLVQNPQAPGTYVCWGNIVDTPEIEPFVLQTGIVVG